MNKTVLNIMMAGCFCGLTFVPRLSHADGGLLFASQLHPTSTVDIGRSITGIVAGIINLSGDGESKAQLIAKQENVNVTADGSYNSGANAAAATYARAAATAFKDGAYAYINQNVWNQKTPYVYDKLAQALGENSTLEATRQAVIDTFYADGENRSNTSYKEGIFQQRQAYAQKVVDFHIQLSQEIQKAIQGDLTAAGQAPVSSDNEVGAMAIDAQTLDEMIKTTLVDLTLQIEMMEADALTFMLHQPVEMLSETKGE